MHAAFAHLRPPTTGVLVSAACIVGAVCKQVLAGLLRLIQGASRLICVGDGVKLE